MADTTLYDTMAPSVGSVALAHQKLIRMKVSGVFINITGDVNNLAFNPTKITVPREVYGRKGRPGEDVIGYSYAPSFDVEVVRDPVTKQIVAAQAWFKDLVNAAFSEGEANKREFQLFTDALDEDMPVLEGKFSVSWNGGNSGFADKGVVTFGLASDGIVPRITSPLAGSQTPILESASPSGRAPGDLIKVRGYKLAGVTAATIDGQAVTKILTIDENTLGLLIPTAVSGSAPITVTNAAGTSDALPYAAA
jgi:hypothetical protein